MEKYIGLIIIVIVLICVGVIAISIFRKINRGLRQVQSTLNTVNNTVQTVNMLSEVFKDAAETPDVKSISGATNLYLNKIMKDFPQFHNADAENEVASFIKDFVNIKFGKEITFKNTENTRMQFNIQKEKNGTISNLKINKIAISNYVKTREYATIIYQVSVGYDFNQTRIETRYIVEYTYQIQNNEIASVSMTCPNCGAAIESTHETKCSYCDAAIVTDTIFNWYITNIKEI